MAGAAELTQGTVVQALLHAAALRAPWDDVCVHYVRCGALLFGPSAATRKPADSWHQAAEAIQAAVGYVCRRVTADAARFCGAFY